jgi:hypothetical protein
MNSNTILSKELGHLQQAGHHAQILLMMNRAKFIKSSISQKTLEIPGNILKVMCLTLHGERQPSLEHWEERMLNQESSSLTTRTSRDTKKQEKDGSKAFIFITLMTFSRLKTTL